jgi:hypothetical protein
LSIGYRTVKAERDGKGKRLLSELELWEVSLVTFPMLPEARVAAKADALDDVTGAHGGGLRGRAPESGRALARRPIRNRRRRR